MMGLIYFREILFFITVLLALFGVIMAIVLMLTDRKKLERRFDEAMLEAPTAEKIADGFYNQLVDNANDDKPIMLNVSQERLIERVADEMERRRKRGDFNG